MTTGETLAILAPLAACALVVGATAWADIRANKRLKRQLAMTRHPSAPCKCQVCSR